MKDDGWHTYGDSIYSAKSVYPTPELRVPLSIVANYSGDWMDETPTWSTGGFNREGFNYYVESDDSVQGETKFGTPTIALNPDGSYTYKGKTTGANEHTTDLTVTDTDGASAAAHYHLTLHDAAEVEGIDFMPYDVNAPMTDGGGAIKRVYAAPPAVQAKVSAGSSTETGYSLSATVGIGLEQELLGFKIGAEAAAESSSTYTIEQKAEIDPPSLSTNQFKYLMVTHHFQRRHVKFWKYDALGQVKRFVSYDNVGSVFNPPLHTYHEAIKDSKSGEPTYYWSDPRYLTVDDVNAIPPTTPIPPIHYDYPSGGSS